MSENGRRENVITTESGLRYEVVEEGDGAKPTARDRLLLICVTLIGYSLALTDA